jgi:glycerol-3-phosphate acyltransferase PlsX
VRVAIDAMGGDYAPAYEVAGTFEALKHLGESAEIILVGRENEIKRELERHNKSELIRVVHAPDVVGMADEPSAIVKNRKESSLYIGIDMMKRGDVDAFVSAGNTGAVMATATMVCGRISGVSRPTIGSFFPTATNKPTLVVDVGANVDSKPRFLYDYALMGEVYSRTMLNITSPTVGLLNVGEEEGKGTENVREAYAMLSRAPIRFVGNVEGRDILSGTVDVVVCDGFEGNIILKFAESVISFLRARFKLFASQSFVHGITVSLFKPVLRAVLRGMDYQDYGGVPLLGVNGIVIIGHGSSTPKALGNMIVRAVEMVQRDVNGQIEQALKQPEESQSIR